MSDELDRILIVEGITESFSGELGVLRASITKAARFERDSEEIGQVRGILHAVVREGDEALVRFTKDYDGVKLTPKEFRITTDELENAHRGVTADSPELMGSIQQAIENVRKYQESICILNKSEMKEVPGIKYVALSRVGICVPGASAPLPSTVIMTAVPAQVAGVKETVVVSPPRHNGSIHPVTLAVCQELGIREVYRIGGAQAVAALGVGTETIPEVDKIVGPGNKWVQTTKQILYGYVGVDSIAGPSEVLIIANEEANPAWVAADMLSQAEHDPGSGIVLTDSQALGRQILDELKKQVQELTRARQTIECLLNFSRIAVFDSMDSVIECANEFATEHLEIHCGKQSTITAEKITNAGAIFIGDYSPVAVGDYWAGPSHTLPTGRTARFSSALTSNDFVKSISIIEYSKEQLAASAEDIIRLAEVEGLDAHARSVRIRQQD